MRSSGQHQDGDTLAALRAHSPTGEEVINKENRTDRKGRWQQESKFKSMVQNVIQQQFPARSLITNKLNEEFKFDPVITDCTSEFLCSSCFCP